MGTYVFCGVMKKKDEKRQKRTKNSLTEKEEDGNINER